MRLIFMADPDHVARLAMLNIVSTRTFDYAEKMFDYAEQALEYEAVETAKLWCGGVGNA